MNQNSDSYDHAPVTRTWKVVLFTLLALCIVSAITIVAQVALSQSASAVAAHAKADFGLDHSNIRATCDKAWFHTHNGSDPVAFETVVDHQAKSHPVPANASKNLILNANPGDSLALKGPADAGVLATATMPRTNRCTSYATSIQFNPCTGLVKALYTNNTNTDRWGTFRVVGERHWSIRLPAHQKTLFKAFFYPGTVVLTKTGGLATNVGKVPLKVCASQH